MIDRAGSARRAGRQWERWGAEDPHFGVLSSEAHRDSQNLEEFHRSGRATVEQLMAWCSANDLAVDVEGRALEFGCGVGRLLGPLASAFGSATGLDVSPGMLELVGELDLDNVEARLAQPPDYGLEPTDEFVFFLTMLVLQHIPQSSGLDALRHCLGHVADRGVAVVHVPTRVLDRLRYGVNHLRSRHQLLFDASRLLTRNWSEVGRPYMQMNRYEPDALDTVWADLGFTIVDTETQTDDDAYLEFTTYLLQRRSGR